MIGEYDLDFLSGQLSRKLFSGELRGDYGTFAVGVEANPDISVRTPALTRLLPS